MVINYIILAHKNPKQLKRLIETLSSYNCFFYVHIDKNVVIEPFLNETENLENVFFLPHHKRENGTWGDIGIVKATINALKEVLTDKRMGHLILLSAQDYPIQSNKNIESFLSDNKANNFIEIFPIPTDYWSNKGENRINKYKFNISNRRHNFIQICSIFESEFYTVRTFKDIFRLVKYKKHSYLRHIFVKRNFPNYIKPYGGGSQWWAITYEMANRIIKFLEDYPDYLKYHHYTLVPDEIFFHSIIMHFAENDSEIKINNSLTYVNWAKKSCELPVTFTSTDFKELTSQTKEKFFARKFDNELDEEILDQIDDFRNL